MKTKRFWSLRLAVVLVLLLLGAALFVTRASAGSKETTYRWDIVSIDFAKGTLSAGGMASASCNNLAPAVLLVHPPPAHGFARKSR